MQKFKAVYIGNGLYEVYIDGAKQGIPCELDRLGMLYSEKWEKEHSGLLEDSAD